MDILTTRSEVVEELIARVKQNRPDVSIDKGTPAYDLLVQHFADVIADERELININTNIARVSPMFDSDGQLLPEYADLDKYLTDRFFISRPDASEVYDTLYLLFNRKGGVHVLNGSYVMYGNTKFTVQPTYIDVSSSLWRKVPEGYIYPVNIGTLSDDSLFIPATTDWTTGGVVFDADPGCFVIGAVSRKTINTVLAPKVTFDYLRYSISNRSLSNPRSILYNIRNNTGFSPDQLNRARVLSTSEPAFVERRKVLYTDPAGYSCSAIVSGDGKVMLDYGVELYTAPVDVEYVDKADPVYSELNPLIEKANPNGMVSEISLDGAKVLEGHIEAEHTQETDPETNETTCYLTLTAKISFTRYGDDTEDNTISGQVQFEELDGVPESARIWLYNPGPEPEDNQKPAGWITVHCTPAMFHEEDGVYVTETFEYYRDRFLVYRIDTAGLGVLSPVSVGKQDEMNSTADILTSTDPDNLLASGTVAASGCPGSTLTVHYNEGSAEAVLKADFSVGTIKQFEDNEAVKNILNITSDTVYWKFIKENRFQLSTDPTFLDRDKSYGTFPVPEGAATLDCMITDTFRVTVEIDSDHPAGSSGWFTVPSTFLRFDNRYLYFSVNPDALLSTNSFSAYLLYYGTAPDLMEKAQQLYLNHRLAEIGNRIIVSPFRPFVFTAYWAPEYVTQYMHEVPNMTEEEEERLDTLKSRFIELQAYLERWFSDFRGKISEIDFVEVAKGGQNATGLVIKRLDFTLFTQRGYPVRGWLDINLDKTCHLVWEEITDIIIKQVDDDIKFISSEREANVTDETLYRPLFSRVGI